MQLGPPAAESRLIFIQSAEIAVARLWEDELVEEPCPSTQTPHTPSPFLSLVRGGLSS